MRALILFWPLLVVAAEAPAWLREVATVTTPSYDAKVKAVVLLNEEQVSLEASGKRSVHIRKAIRILQRDGRREAIGGFAYDSRGSKVRDLRAWVLSSSGKWKEYGRKEMSEGAAQPDFTLYSTSRHSTFNAAADVDPGAVFGIEGTLDEDTVFSQFLFYFQDDLPHLLSRFQLTVPPGWEASAKAYQGAKAEPLRDGQTYTWEARNLGPVEVERFGPGLAKAIPAVFVGLTPPEGVALASGPIACFRSWADVAAWKSGLIDPQSTATLTIQAKAAELTAGLTTPLAKVEALARFVQSLRYVSISINSARGGGYTPHAAEEVLRAAYGDCKDKANLLRALLRAIQVESFPVAIYSGNPHHTREDFPSPHQFNHAILAIRAPAEWEYPASAVYPGHGRLLFFDPTNTYVRFGHLPHHEQDSPVLLTAAQGGGLLRTPTPGPRGNVVRRNWELTLADTGQLSGELTEVRRGRAAFETLALMEDGGEESLRKSLQVLLGRAMAAAEIRKLEHSFDAESASFTLKLSFTAPEYARILQGRLWMLRSLPAPFEDLPPVSLKTRQQPLQVPAIEFEEVAEWKLPASLQLDEMPGSGKLTHGLGQQVQKWEKAEGGVQVTRSLVLNRGLVAPADYANSREFFARFHGAAETAIVLVKAK